MGSDTQSFRLGRGTDTPSRPVFLRAWQAGKLHTLGLPAPRLRPLKLATLVKTTPKAGAFPAARVRFATKISRAFSEETDTAQDREAHRKLP